MWQCNVVQQERRKKEREWLCVWETNIRSRGSGASQFIEGKMIETLLWMRLQPESLKSAWVKVVQTFIVFQDSLTFGFRFRRAVNIFSSYFSKCRPLKAVALYTCIHPIKISITYLHTWIVRTWYAY